MKFASGVRAVPVRNRDRGQLLHSLDARHGRLMVGDLEAAVRDLCRSVDAATIDCVLGFPEGGTAPAFVAAQVLERPLVLSTRIPHSLPNEIRFEEPHIGASNAPTLFIYALNPGDRVVIVEDEITSGRTLINAIRALRAAGVLIDDVLVLLTRDDPDLLVSIEAEGVRVTARELVPIEVSQAVASNRSL